MGDFLFKLRLLGDTLEKKHNLLRQILSITENQETILLNYSESASTADIRETQGISPSPVSTTGDMFNEMNEEKQKLINELLQADAFFQNIFNEISPDFEANAKEHKTEIAMLQDLIRAVTDFDVKIRLQERKNRDIINRVVPKTKIPVPKAPKEYVLKQYELNSKNPNKKKK